MGGWGGWEGLQLKKEGRSLTPFGIGVRRGGWGLRAGLVMGSWLASLGGAPRGATAPHPNPSRNGAVRAEHQAAGTLGGAAPM